MGLDGPPDSMTNACGCRRAMSQEDPERPERGSPEKPQVFPGKTARYEEEQQENRAAQAFAFAFEGGVVQSRSPVFTCKLHSTLV